MARSSFAVNCLQFLFPFCFRAPSRFESSKFVELPQSEFSAASGSLNSPVLIPIDSAIEQLDDHQDNKTRRQAILTASLEAHYHSAKKVQDRMLEDAEADAVEKIKENLGRMEDFYGGASDGEDFLDSQEMIEMEIERELKNAEKTQEEEWSAGEEEFG